MFALCELETPVNRPFTRVLWQKTVENSNQNIQFRNSNKPSRCAALTFHQTATIKFIKMQICMITVLLSE